MAVMYHSRTPHLSTQKKARPALPAPQTYKNHSRFDPIFHFFLVPACVANVIVISVWHARHPDVHRHATMWAIFMAVVFWVAVMKIRLYALHNQDRTIRLEESVRYRALLPPDLLERSAILSLKQVIALRFASDAELPKLIERTLAEGLQPKVIKQSIQTWRPDLHRI